MKSIVVIKLSIKIFRVDRENKIKHILYVTNVGRFTVSPLRVFEGFNKFTTVLSASNSTPWHWNIIFNTITIALLGTVCLYYSAHVPEYKVTLLLLCCVCMKISSLQIVYGWFHSSRDRWHVSLLWGGTCQQSRSKAPVNGMISRRISTPNCKHASLPNVCFVFWRGFLHMGRSSVNDIYTKF